MTAVTIAIIVGYFWMAVCVGTMQLERYHRADGYVDDSDEFAAFCAGAAWPITLLVWTAKGVARWWME